MRITDRADIGGINFPKPEKGKEKAGTEKGGEVINRDDQVKISDSAKEIGRLQLAVSKLPDIRADRVEEVKNAITAGTYNVKGEAVAGKLLKETIVDHIIR
jgi:negative regulator of flagellin synthesis FlgM